MKTAFIGILCLCMCSISAYSQIAVRGGLNYSKVSVDNGGPNIGSDNKPGFHVGLQTNLSLGGFLGLRPALLYHLKGGKSETTGGNTSNSNLHYFEVPMNLGLLLGSENARIIIEAGPYFGYLLNASSGIFNDLGDNLKKTDWGANFGAVVEISNLGIGANYSNSLSSIAKEDQFTQAFKLKNGNLALFLYIKF